MYVSDVQNGEHEIYLDNGFDVYTAGNPYDERFIERFYDILKSKYTTSNNLGSQIFYSIEMDIPFFIYGDFGKLINKDDVNLDIGEYNLLKFSKYRQVYDLFKVDNLQDKLYITEEQRSLIKQYVGTSSSIIKIAPDVCLVLCFFSVFF